MTSRRSFVGGGVAAFALSRTPLALGSTPMVFPGTPALQEVRVHGDAGKRLRQNMGRLESDCYRVPEVFQNPNAKSWPGDFEGRALLAMTLLARSTGDEPGYLAEMLPAYKARLNSKGYFGELLDLHAVDEQQLSGHGWLLRGLAEYYESKHDPRALAMLTEIVENLALPLRGRYRTYPIDPALRTRTGDVNGTLTARHGDWVLSSDTGCAFIFVDGLAHAWTLTRDPRLKPLIDEAIARFLEIDLVRFGAQTHATLTCLRALLRVYAETGEPALLAAVRSRYALYRAVGMTEHYANYNWFDRPETWTEPCAIIDSFMIAFQLWQFTGEPTYLEDAHLIWFNGVGRGMRANGGFGTDRCAGFATPFLAQRTYEAFFCCTMRGGEGYARAAQSSYTTRGDEVSVPFFNDSEATLRLDAGTIKVRQTAAYPFQGAVRLELMASSCAKPVTFRFFAPRWARNLRVTRNGEALKTTAVGGFVGVRFIPRAGDTLVLNHTLLVGPRNTMNPEEHPGVLRV